MQTQRRIVGVAAAALIVVGLASIAPRTGTAGAPTKDVVITHAVTFEPGTTRVPSREASPDAELIGKVLGETADDGSAWQDAQSAMSDFVEDLAVAAGDRFVGQFALRSTPYSTVVRVTAGDPITGLEDLARRVAYEIGVPITVQYVDAPPYSTLMSELDSVSSELSRRGYSAASRIDDTITQIVLIPELGVTTTSQVEAVATDVLGSTPFRVEDPQPGQESFSSSALLAHPLRGVCLGHIASPADEESAADSSIAQQGTGAGTCR